MPQTDYLVLMGIGGLLIFLGLVAIIWGRIEAKGYYDSLSGRTDVREYLEHWPPHSKSGTLKAGGWIAFTIGLIMLVVGGCFRLWGLGSLSSSPPVPRLLQWR